MNLFQKFRYEHHAADLPYDWFWVEVTEGAAGGNS